AGAFARRLAHGRSKPRAGGVVAGAVSDAGGGAADPGVRATEPGAASEREHAGRAEAHRYRWWLDVCAGVTRSAQRGECGDRASRTRARADLYALHRAEHTPARSWRSADGGGCEVARSASGAPTVAAGSRRCGGALGADGR